MKQLPKKIYVHLEDGIMVADFGIGDICHDQDGMIVGMYKLCEKKKLVINFRLEDLPKKVVPK
jgi:hypothetical protein